MRRRARREPETCLVTGVTPQESTGAEVASRFRGLVEGGARLACAGRARRRPELLLTPRYMPRAEIRLFDASYFLSDYRFDEEVGFFVGYVALGERGGKRVRAVYPRMFYKDSSLLWRVASHFARDGAVWIGKGDVRREVRGDWELQYSAEETTNLPYEIQFALDEVSRQRRSRRDDDALELVVRQAPPGRIAPYADFTRPRRRAAARYRIHAGRPVARFLRRGDPRSLRFERGYEPDFRRGVLEQASSASAFYGGRLEKVRILSTNKKVQYLFLASPTHAWVCPPQLLTTELSTYGVRTLDIPADEDAFLPGYEYHDADRSQIPSGYAGEPHPDNPDRADASAWLEELPVIQSFRARILRRRRY